jgi:N-acetylmuramoyl-L-alanine amidase
MQVVRVKPGMGYSIIWQPKGVQALAVGAEGDWYRLKLSASQYGYVSRTAVEKLPFGILPPRSSVKSVRTYGFDDSVLIEFPLAGIHPFRVIEDDKRTVRIQLFGVTSNTDWIRYDFNDTLIEFASWNQPEEGLYELRLNLKQDLWGYDCSYKGNSFIFKLIKPPHDVHDLRGKRIVVDPGHSADLGAVGPTGYTEAEANLALALAVKEMLAVRGAQVVLTRSDMRDLPLTDRPAIAVAKHADLFVSIHNNAQPDGVNPYRNNGVSTYYYHRNSIDFARAIQRQMIEQTGLPDYGLYFGNLHVDRPTQYPAVLVECAFIIIPEQEALLKTDKFRTQVAKAITAGIETFLKEYNHGQ